MNERAYDLAVIGAGSGGIGAAVAGARLGLRTVLVEKAGGIGGTAVRGGVHCWEPCAGGTGIPFDIYRRLRRITDAVGIYSIGRHCCYPDRASEQPPYPGGESVIDPRRRYIDSLLRSGVRSMGQDEAFCREHWHGVPFEPEPYVRVVEGMLAETGRCTVLTGVGFSVAQSDGKHISAVHLDNGQVITAGAYVDCTADAKLAIAAGAKFVKGQESRDTYGEPHAPEKPTNRINGVTLIFRASPLLAGEAPRVEPLPDGIPEKCWWRPQFPVVSVNHYPCGDLNLNMLPTMEGVEFAGLSYPDAYAECRRRVYVEWHHLQRAFPEFQRFRMSWIAPELGVREGARIVADYVLTEHDVLAGLRGQKHGDIIAIADHAMDTHGASTGRAGCGEVKEPYGIPYRCLIPKGFDNLLVACRGAGFSSLAASSCRLSRTMMQLGQAAGTAAAVAKRLGVAVSRCPPDALRARLREQHVQLEWPMSDALREYLLDEDSVVDTRTR